MEGWLTVAKVWTWAVVAAGTVVAFAVFAIVISLLFVAFMTLRGHCSARDLRATPGDPNHPVPLFPPYQGL
jgi:hypothetical protein